MNEQSIFDRSEAEVFIWLPEVLRDAGSAKE
jgi:hypothetical protein